MKIKVDIDHLKKSDCPSGCKERQFCSLLLGQVEVSMYYPESQFDLPPCPPGSANAPKSIDVELFEYSDGVMRGSDRGRNQPKDGCCPDSVRKPVSASQSMQTSEIGPRKSSATPIL